MNISCLFSAFSLVAVFVYMYIGFYTYKQNRTSNINITFLILCISYAIWSLAYAFAYVSTDNYTFYFWNKISAFGWTSFSAITLFLVLLITENKFIKKKIIKLSIFSPAAVFLFMAIFLFGDGINTSPIVSGIFYIGDFLYNFSFLSISIAILFIWGIKSESIRIKKQAKILVLTSIIPFLLNLLTQNILPMVGVKNLPLMGQLYSLIMIIGTYLVITEYKFLKLPEKIIFDEVANKIMDMIIIINERGDFIKVSKNTTEMLGYDENELLNKNINYIFSETNNEVVSVNDMKQQDKRYSDINILKKNGETLPVNISCIPIFDAKIQDFLGVALVMQDISIIHELKRKNEELKQRAIRDSLTNLYNHQYSMKLIKKEVDKALISENTKEFSIMIIDIDLFKSVNDTFGHQFGDYVITTVSAILMNNVNGVGYVGRFGGEEFVIILPQIEINEACYIGEKIRNDIENYKFDNSVRLTVSIGIKQHRGESSLELVKVCDDLLYKAKQNGRNTIESDY